MYTRAQVARLLGKSISTVRRMEGIELHPWRDARGVHQFNEAEVNMLARDEGDGRPHPNRLGFSCEGTCSTCSRPDTASCGQHADHSEVEAWLKLLEALLPAD